MRIITPKILTNAIIDGWRARPPLPQHSYTRKQCEMIRDLLEKDNPSPNEVNDILGYNCAETSCGQCGSLNIPVVHFDEIDYKIGDDGYCDASIYIYICKNCLLKALQLIGQE